MTAVGVELGPAYMVCDPAVRHGHYGVWRGLTSLPSMVGSLLLLLVLFGWMGEWEGLILLGWLALAAAMFTRLGERLTVAAGCGFRRLSSSQYAALYPVWSAALAQARIGTGEVDLFVQRSADLNAYAAGGRSVAVTTGVLQAFLARRLSDDEVRAVLVHELGHHATRATRVALITMWLTLPWRTASRLVIGLGLNTVGRRQPRLLLALVAAAGVVVAVVQAVQRGEVGTAVVLCTVATCTVVCPVTDAWLGRCSEYAADRFAATCGQAAALSSALTRMDAGTRRLGWNERALRRHPTVSRRVEALNGFVVTSDRR